MMPELEGKMGCNAVRVPTLNVSVIDLVLRTEQDVTVEQIHSQLGAGRQFEICRTYGIHHRGTRIGGF